MSDLNIRRAIDKDVDFLVETIIEAEKSGTETLSFTTIFKLSVGEIKKCLTNILLEDLEGCELSVSSFFVAEIGGKIAAAVSAWLEGGATPPSAIIKGNLLGYYFPKNAIQHAIDVMPITSTLNIEHRPDAIQIGVTYVHKEFRGRQLAKLLIQKQIAHFKANNPDLDKCYIQVFSLNAPAIRAYEELGFTTIEVKESFEKRITEFLPGNKKILMSLDI